MPGSLRKSANSWFTRIFMFILVLSFAIWGVADFLTGQAEPPLAKVAGATITAQEFDGEFRRELSRLQQQFGPEFTTAKAREIGFDREVLRQMLVGQMFDHEADNLSLTAADATIAQLIRENPEFKDAFGEFDRNKFAAALRNNGFTEKEFLRRARLDSTRRQLIAVIAAGIRTPETLSGALYAMGGETRSADVLHIPQSAAGNPGKPSEADLEAFHKANEALFTSPERRSVSYITLRPEELATEIKPEEAELREYYDAHLAEFTVTGMRNLLQFVLPDEAAAKAAADKINKGADFATVGRAASGLNKNEMELLEITLEKLPREISAAVFALKEGEVSAPLKSPFGWHVVKVTAARQERVDPFEDVRGKIARDLALNRATDLVVERSNQLEDARAGGASLEEAAKELNLNLRSVADIDRAGLGPDGKPSTGIPAGPKFMEDVFATGEGSESDLRENREGGYYVLRVDKITPAALRPLPEVREDVTAGWRAQKTGEALEKLSEELLIAAKAGKKLEEIGRPLKLKPVRTAPFGRDFTSEQLGNDLVAKLFAAKPGEPVAGPAPGGGFVIASVHDIQRPELSAQKEAAEKMNKELAKRFEEDVLAQYQAVLERRYRVEINPERLDSLFEGQP